MPRPDFRHIDLLRVLYPDATPAELADTPCPHKSGQPIATAACCELLRRYLITGVRSVPAATDADLDDLALLHAPDTDVAALLRALEVDR